LAQRYRNELLHEEQSLLNTYARQQIAFRAGKGSRLWDSSGNEYIDMVAGIAVNSLGYAHPRLVAAICNQASSLIHCSNLYEIENQKELARRLSALAGGHYSLFFSNSGAEANEAALKFAVRCTGRNRIVAAHNSFHGRTAATLSVTGQQKYWKGFEPLLNGGVAFADFGNIDSFREKLDSSVAAVIIEPIQGEGGIVLPPEGFLSELSKAVHSNGSLLIVDEVQTGTGRTGRFFAYQWERCTPDIISTAKGLAGGVPIGATLVRNELSSCIKPGDHGSTFGGNPLSTAAALAVLDVVGNNAFLKQVAEKGAHLLSGLNELFSDVPQVSRVTGRGLMVGIHATPPFASAFRDFAFSRGFIVNVVHENTVRLVPPLIISEEELHAFLLMARAFARERGHGR